MLSTLTPGKRSAARRILSVAALMAATGLAGCGADEESPAPRNNPEVGFELRDASGLAHYRENLFVIVRDTDLLPASPRLGVIAMREDAPPAYRPLNVDWTRVGHVPDDLESICAVPGATNEFLVVESGAGAERPARIIRLRLTGIRLNDVRAQVDGKIDLPEIVHNIEGATLIPGADGRLVLVLCERDERKAAANAGGSDERQRHTLLLWAGIDLDGYRLDGPLRTTAVHAAVWPAGPGRVRTCSDLFYDAEAAGGPRLWIAATADPGAVGPFQSIVYRARVAQHDLARPEGLTMRAAWRMDGLKVEGLAAPLLPGAGLTMVTDEDLMGGVIRSLPAPTLLDDGDG